jgi:hypothetical protein
MEKGRGARLPLIGALLKRPQDSVSNTEQVTLLWVLQGIVSLCARLELRVTIHRNLHDKVA